MDHLQTEEWLRLLRSTVASYREMVDQTIEQLSDAELFARPAPGVNSVAVLLCHLGGNLQSRWTDFLTTDGEKPNRNRDTEFEDWDGDRESLLRYFDQGWKALYDGSRFDRRWKCWKHYPNPRRTSLHTASSITIRHSSDISRWPNFNDR